MTKSDARSQSAGDAVAEGSGYEHVSSCLRDTERAEAVLEVDKLQSHILSHGSSVLPPQVPKMEKSALGNLEQSPQFQILNFGFSVSKFLHFGSLLHPRLVFLLLGPLPCPHRSEF